MGRRPRAQSDKRVFKYEQLRTWFRQAVLNHEFQPGDPVPSQNEMAKRLGVSTSTVREAIGSLVHEGLLYRIQGKGTFVADWKPRRPVIGVVLPHLDPMNNPVSITGYEVIVPLVSAIEDEARKNDAVVVLRLSCDDSSIERQNLLDLLDEKVQGVIAFAQNPGGNADCLKRIRHAGIALTMVDRYCEGVDADYVVSDNFKGACDAVNRLKEMDCRSLLYVTIPPVVTPLQQRLAGVNSTSATHGIETEVLEVVRLKSFNLTAWGASYSGLKKYLRDNAKLPDAILASNAELLLGVWLALREHIDSNFPVLACFDEMPRQIKTDSPLLKIIQPLEEMGRTSVQIIMGKLRGDPTVRHMVLPQSVQLVEKNAIDDEIQLLQLSAAAAEGSEVNN